MTEIELIQRTAQREARRIRAAAIRRGRGRTNRTADQRKQARIYLDALHQMLGDTTKPSTGDAE